MNYKHLFDLRSSRFLFYSAVLVVIMGVLVGGPDPLPVEGSQDRLRDLRDQLAELERRLRGQEEVASDVQEWEGEEFTEDLNIGSHGSEVQRLQEWLNQNGYTVAETGYGSSGQETEYFGLATQQAVAAFQEDRGITPAEGYFGPVTRRQMNELLEETAAVEEPIAEPQPEEPDEDRNKYDVTGDGQVTQQDVDAVMDCLLDREGCDEDQRRRADITGTGQVDSNDLRAVISAYMDSNGYNGTTAEEPVDPDDGEELPSEDPEEMFQGLRNLLAPEAEEEPEEEEKTANQVIFGDVLGHGQTPDLEIFDSLPSDLNMSGGYYYTGYQNYVGIWGIESPRFQSWERKHFYYWKDGMEDAEPAEEEGFRHYPAAGYWHPEYEEGEGGFAVIWDGNGNTYLWDKERDPQFIGPDHGQHQMAWWGFDKINPPEVAYYVTDSFEQGPAVYAWGVTEVEDPNTGLTIEIPEVYKGPPNVYFVEDDDEAFERVALPVGLPDERGAPDLVDVNNTTGQITMLFGARVYRSEEGDLSSFERVY